MSLTDTTEAGVDRQDTPGETSPRPKRYVPGSQPVRRRRGAKFKSDTSSLPENTDPFGNVKRQPSRAGTAGGKTAPKRRK